MPRMHLPHPGGNQPVSRGFDPVQESQHVSHPERRNGSEFRGKTFFPPPNNQTGYPGYQNAFTYSPVAGISIPLNKPSPAIDIGLRYESRLSGDGNINQAALRVAYKFGL